MSFKRELKKISELEVGDFNGYIIVRVERIIRVSQICFPRGPHRPMIEPQGVHIIVFDGSVRVFVFVFSPLDLPILTDLTHTHPVLFFCRR